MVIFDSSGEKCINKRCGGISPTKYAVQYTRTDIHNKAAADITGQLQVRPMLYTLYIDINLRVVKMIHTDNKQQITK